MIKLAPSILSADFGSLLQDVKRVEKAGVDLLHVDVMDGHFVPNITLGPCILNSIKGKTDLPFDVHLMIENPDVYVTEFVKAGANSITVHIEACKHIHRTIQNIKSHGVKAGVAINPGTSITLIEDILEDIDVILIMSVNPGFGGQKFIPSTLAKINKVKEKIETEKLRVDIAVDGGIKLDNVRDVIDAGANILVAGSAIFNSDNIEKTVQLFKDTINKK